MADLVPFVSTYPYSLRATNRRRANRHLRNRVCYAKPNGKNAGVAWGVRMWDISNHGVGLILPFPLQSGTLIALQPTRNNHHPIVYARVLWQQQHEHGWLHGCEFLQRLDDADLERWLAD